MIRVTFGFPFLKQTVVYYSLISRRVYFKKLIVLKICTSNADELSLSLLLQRSVYHETFVFVNNNKSADSGEKVTTACSYIEIKRFCIIDIGNCIFLYQLSFYETYLISTERTSNRINIFGVEYLRINTQRLV